MYIEDLISLFREITAKIEHDINIDDYVNDLRNEIESKNYDLQDQTIIETVVRDERDSFTESFNKALQNSIPGALDKIAFFNSDEGKQKVVYIFLKSLEHSIDYYYNEIISKQFSGS